MRRILRSVAVGSLAVSACAGGLPTGAVARTPSAPAACTTGTCWVAVSVATLWVSPSYPRSVDRPALANPAGPRAWVHNMTVQQKRWLVGKLETQASYGTKVMVVGHSGPTWSKVVVPSQPTNRDARGYPGWVPTRQLTSTRPAASSSTAVVNRGTAWLHSGWSSQGVAGRRVMELSYGTRLPVVSASRRVVVVALIGGRHEALARGSVQLHQRGASWSASAAGLVREARKFLGLGYLWAGTSGFAFDCSGFTYSVFRRFGITLSRDADQQAVHGTAVRRRSLQPGDLVFFRDTPSGSVAHVGIYVGNGDMIDAPHTGAAVRVEPLTDFAYYAGARRMLR